MQRVTEKGQQLSGSDGRIAGKSEVLSLILGLLVSPNSIEEPDSSSSAGEYEVSRLEFDFIEGRGRSR